MPYGSGSYGGQPYGGSSAPSGAQVVWLPIALALSPDPVPALALSPETTATSMNH